MLRIMVDAKSPRSKEFGGLWVTIVEIDDTKSFLEPIACDSYGWQVCDFVLVG